MSRVVATIHAEDPGYAGQLLDAIDSSHASVVCFDYFDTLVTRSIHPEDVKRLACERLARILGLPTSGDALYQQRRALEEMLCQRNSASGADMEFDIRSLLAELWASHPACQGIERERFVETAVDVEVSVECAVQTPDPSMVTVLRKLRESGRECWLISDFYMPYRELSRILVHHGLCDLFTQIHVSSDSLLTKRSGRLYPHAMNHGSRDARSLLMIGDNVHSDVASAIGNDIAAIRIDRDCQHRRYQSLTIISNDTELTGHEVDQVLAQSEAPFKELALTLYRFVDELHHRLIRHGARDVFFMAREGQLLKRMFDSYQERRHAKESSWIRSHYIEVSRRATFLPSLKPIAEESFETLFRQYRRISIDEFLSSLGLSHLSPALAATTPHSLSERMEDLPSSDAYASILDNPIFRNAYEQERTARRRAFMTYLGSFDQADPSTQDMHFVDVGWKGTIQDNIRNILLQSGGESASKRLHGHYLGLVASGSANDRNLKSGIVFSCVAAESRNFPVFNENRALFEVALGADHGSAYSYEANLSGGASVVRHDFSEASLFFSKIQPLQGELFRLFESLDELLVNRVLPAYRLEALATRHHGRMVFNPTPAEIRWFEDAYHVENFGVFETSSFRGKEDRPGILGMARFYLDMRARPSELDLGFWPWLTCLYRGGPLVARRYARARLRKIKRQ